MSLLGTLGLKSEAIAPKLFAVKASRAGAQGGKPPAVRKARRERNDAELKELAKWPTEAHRLWKRLSGREQVALLVHMQGRYGKSFAQQFFGFTKSGARSDWATFGGPFPEYNAEWFAAKGYQLVQKDSQNQWFAHPSGHVMVGPFGAAGARRANQIADQKAIDAALAAIAKAIFDAELEQATIRGMESFMHLTDASDPDRPRQYKIYIEHLAAMESKVESEIAKAEALRAQLAKKGIDVGALNQPIADLIALGAWASGRLAPDMIDVFAPRGTKTVPDPPVPPVPPGPPDLPDTPPIDYSDPGP